MSPFRIVIIGVCARIVGAEYITAAAETAFPAQWGGNTYWKGTVKNIILRITNKQQPNKKTIALTFDDGPSRYTPEILEQLKNQKLKATFFMMGRQVQAHPDIAKKVKEEGHEIGNHGYDLVAQKGINKLYLPSLSPHELQKSQSIIINTTGHTPKYYRPPGGQLGRNLWRQVSALNLTTITGTLPFPEASDNAAEQMRIITENIKAGSILILHDGDDANPNSNRGKNVVELMPILFEYLEKEGYQVVTLNALLGKNGE